MALGGIPRHYAGESLEVADTPSQRNAVPQSDVYYQRRCRLRPQLHAARSQATQSMRWLRVNLLQKRAAQKARRRWL
jgi:hypothetical protein